MERELPPYRAAVTRRTHTSIWPVLIIAVVLIAAIAGVLRIYAGTRAAWERNQRPSPNTLISQRIDKQPTRIEIERANAIREAAVAERKLRELTEARERGAKLRCINGQLFRRLENGWENIPGQRCHY